MTLLSSLPFLPDDLLSKLIIAQILTVESVVELDVRGLMKKSSLTKEESEQVLHCALRSFSSPMINALELKENLESSSVILPTGCSGLNNLLQGGLFTGEVYEFIGPSACGKTQLCHSLTFQTVAWSSATVLYFDTANTFSTERIHQMFVWEKKRVEIDDEITNEDRDQEALTEVLSRIRVVRCSDIFQLLSYLHQLIAQSSEQGRAQCPPFLSSLRLVIIDSVAALITPILGIASRGHALMTQLGLLLKQLSFDFHIAIAVTNHVRADGGPSLGEYWGAISHHRVFMKKISPLPTISFRVLKSVRQGTSESITATITEQGIV